MDTPPLKKKGLIETSLLKIKLKALNLDVKKTFLNSNPTTSPLPTPQTSPGTSPREEQKQKIILPLQDTLDFEKLRFEQHNAFSPRNILESMQKELILPRKYFEFREEEKPKGRLFKFKVEELNNINLQGKQQIEIMLQNKIQEGRSTSVPSLFSYSGSVPSSPKLHLDDLEEKLLLARSFRITKSPSLSPKQPLDTKSRNEANL